MADIRATQSGDFSSTATWNGGVVPGSGDVAFANTFTVTVSNARTVQAISNAAGTGITAGGTFSLLNGCNLTCTNANGVVQGATATSCITTPSLGLGSSASVAAIISHAVAFNNCGSVSFSTAGTLSITGNLAGGSLTGSGTFAITVSGTGVLNVTGNVTGGVGTGHGMIVSGAATISIVGNVTGGVSVGLGITMTTGTVSVNGNVTGAGASGITNGGSGTLTVTGICQSSTTAPAIGAGSPNQNTRLSGPFLLGASGNINPIQAQSWRWAPTQIPTYYEVAASNGTTKRSLFTSDNIPTGNYPVTANVRSGTVYGPNNENTGTLAVPATASVALGVPVGNGVGEAILTAASVRSAMGLATDNLDAQLTNIPAAVRTNLTPELSRIQNCSTVDTTAQTVQNAVSS